MTSPRLCGGDPLLAGALHVISPDFASAQKRGGCTRTRNGRLIRRPFLCPARTNIVTAVEITGSYANDGPQFPALLDATAQSFRISEVSADKGYASVENQRAAHTIGARAYIPFKSNATGEGGGCAIWRKMWHYYNFNRDEFLEHYHKRSNVETTFNMIKGKFGDHLRSKGDTAQINELLCKILAHNICVLIHSMHELGVDLRLGQLPA